MATESSYVGDAAYDRKSDAYFAGVRADFVAELPDDPAAAILEIGCAEGGTGALALLRGKCARYVGVELHPTTAEVARTRLTEVIVGNVEDPHLILPQGPFDALVMSEVLEHLADPWAAINRLSALLKPGAMVLASSPNISHHRVIRQLLRGHWTLAEQGVMDRTHLRWFTPAAYARMFTDCGLVVEKVGPVRPLGYKARALDAITGRALTHLFMTQISLRARKP